MELQWLSLYILKVYTSGNMLYLHTCCLAEDWPDGMIAGRPALEWKWKCSDHTPSIK